MAIKLKSPKQIEKLRAANRLVAETFARLEEEIRPGVQLNELDRIATAYIESQGAQSLYRGYQGNPPTHPPFPGTICASINEEICHGLPNSRRLSDGDIIGIDIGLRLDGWCGDACITFAVGEISPEKEQLLQVTRECLALGIEQAQPGNRLTDIGAAIQAHAESHGYGVVREWGGHGVGRSLHEEPSVPHLGPPGQGPRLRPGMVFTIEPMINAGGPEWLLLDDGWTVITKDRSLSAQFEHTIAVTKDGPEILSRL